jgi:hypothetical protein
MSAGNGFAEWIKEKAWMIGVFVAIIVVFMVIDRLVNSRRAEPDSGGIHLTSDQIELMDRIERERRQREQDQDRRQKAEERNKEWERKSSAEKQKELERLDREAARDRK